jgi:VanZ family protein
MTQADSGAFLASVRLLGRLALRLPRAFWLATSAAWGVMIWSFSSRSPSNEQGSGLWSWISNMAHAPLFGLLALMLALALPREETALGHKWARFGVQDFRLAFWAVVLFGLTDEFHQSMVPGRNASVFDLITDWSAAYITLGVAVVAGRAGTQEPAFRKRLGLGVLICCLTGLLATFF